MLFLVICYLDVIHYTASSHAVCVYVLIIIVILITCTVSEYKGKGLDTCYSATYMSGLVTSSALQSRKWQLIGMSQWCCSALCGHPLPALTDSWTNSAASRHTIASISHTRPSTRSHSYYSFPVPLRVGG